MAELGWYEQLARATGHLSLPRVRRWARGSASQDLREAIAFTGIQVTVEEVFILSYLLTGVVLVPFLLADLFLLRILLERPPASSILLVAASGLLPLLVLHFLSEYPKTRARHLRIHSLGDMPEVLSYVVMSMKLVPNLETALWFAADNSARPLARDLRRLLWQLNMRAYEGMDHAIDDFADRWGRWNDHFRRAIHLVKSSQAEPTEAQRIITLNRALDVALDGTRGMMESFSRQLFTPTVVLYSIGVMIPLALVAILPAASTIGIKISLTDLFLVYDVFLPLGAIAYGEHILSKRPASFGPPVIPGDHPGLGENRSKAILAALGAALGFGALYWFPLGVVPRSFAVLWAIAAAISTYCLLAYRPHKRVRDRVKRMEAEFADALFIMGRRISEGRSPEESLAHAARVMDQTAIAGPFQAAAYNLVALHTDLYGALFHPEYGALQRVYSDRIRAVMLLFIESVEKSHEATGVAVVKIADHLKELQDVEEDIRGTLYTTTSMMRTTAVVFAPLIAGVTLALGGHITRLLAETTEKLSGLPESAMSYLPMVPRFQMMGLDMDAFALVLGLYILILTGVLTRFTGGIDHGDDWPQYMYELGYAVPTATVVFTLATALSQWVFQMII